MPDRKLFEKYRELMRDVVTIAICALVVVSLMKAEAVDRRQDEGRAIGSAIQCAGISAVIDSGVLLLQRVGAGVRARDYAEPIAQEIRDELRRLNPDAAAIAVVRKDGTLDCAAVREAAGLPAVGLPAGAATVPVR